MIFFLHLLKATNSCRNLHINITGPLEKWTKRYTTINLCMLKHLLESPWSSLISILFIPHVVLGSLGMLPSSCGCKRSGELEAVKHFIHLNVFFFFFRISSFHFIFQKKAPAIELLQCCCKDPLYEKIIYELYNSNYKSYKSPVATCNRAYY